MNKETEKNMERAKKSLHKKDAILTTADCNGATEPPTNNQKSFENIVCSPILYWREQSKELNDKKTSADSASMKREEEVVNAHEEEDDDENDDSNQMFYANDMMIDNDDECNLLISSVRGMSEDAQQMSDDKKSSINGLYLRNPRGELYCQFHQSEFQRLIE
jgi:hypothetical protein